MRRFFLLLLVPVLLIAMPAKAQDPQFSQFYAAPLFLNPAFVGNTQQARAGVNYRNQWPGLEASFVTSSAYFDYFAEDYNSGFGILINHDREGLAGLRSTTVGLQYAYQLYLTEWLSFRPGFEVAYYNRNLNFSRLVFGDQFDPVTGLIDGETAESFDTGLSSNFVDLSFGGVLYTENAWIGVSTHHINTPNQSITGGDDPLQVRLSVHGGLKIPLSPGSSKGSNIYNSGVRQRSITPTFQYRSQGEFDQLDLGFYYTTEPLILGLWYRGLPFKPFESFSNNESLIFLVGFTKRGANDAINIGYSYDYTISELGSASGGAHEVSVSYTWPMANPRKPPKTVRQIPCPNF